MTTIKEGDIFQWSYKDEKSGDRGPYKRYHCKSQICVAKDGRLRDTYWNMSGYDDTWSYEEAQVSLRLVYVGNFADLDKSDERNEEFYDEADCVNLNHPNSSRGNFYLRKGAKRSRAKMLEMALHKKERAESEVRYRTQDVERLAETIDRINAGADLSEIWF